MLGRFVEDVFADPFGFGVSLSEGDRGFVDEFFECQATGSGFWKIREIEAKLDWLREMGEMALTSENTDAADEHQARRVDEGRGQGEVH